MSDALRFPINVLPQLIKNLPRQIRQEKIKNLIPQTWKNNGAQYEKSPEILPDDNKTGSIHFHIGKANPVIVVELHMSCGSMTKIYYDIKDFQINETLEKTLIRIKKALIFQEKSERRHHPQIFIALIKYLLQYHHLKNVNILDILQSRFLLEKNNKDLNLEISNIQKDIELNFKIYGSFIKKLHKNLTYKIKKRPYKIHKIQNRSKITIIIHINEIKKNKNICLKKPEIQNFHDLLVAINNKTSTLKKP